MEARWLFGVEMDQVQVVVQPQASSTPWLNLRMGLSLPS